MPNNIWSESRIWKTVFEPDTLVAEYPDTSDRSWMIMWMKGEKQAHSLCEACAASGFVVGKFACNATLDDYIVAVHAPNETEQGEDPLSPLLSGVQDHIMDVYLGWQRVIELGQGALRTPMVGAWNWGRNSARGPAKSATGGTPIDQWSALHCADLNERGVRWHEVEYADGDDTVLLVNFDNDMENDVTFDRVHEAERFAQVAEAYAEEVV